MESKWAIYNLLPMACYPHTLFFKKDTGITEILNSVRKQQFKYPLIGKPDIGMKGLSVKKLENEADLVEYCLLSKVDFLVQEFVPFENEAGIFYYRFPGEKHGHISGIVGKEFLKVTGDGQSSIMDLLKKEKRYVLQLKVLKETYGDFLNGILKEGQEFILVPYGNHVRGSKFTDISYLIDEKLTQAVDKVCRQVDGFYYGRLDIRYHSWEELREGKNFSIIELNGAGSEPTHIYDPGHSVFFAWKEIIKHWNILYAISRMNYDKARRPYMNLRTGLNMLRENKRYVKLIS